MDIPDLLVQRRPAVAAIDKRQLGWLNPAQAPPGGAEFSLVLNYSLTLVEPRIERSARLNSGISLTTRTSERASVRAWS
jgi:hypothetical protein